MAISVCNVHTNGKAKDTAPCGREDFPLACFEDDMAAMTVPIHWHDEVEYITAVAGRVTVTLDTEEAVLEEGDGVMINGGCLHAVRPVTGGVSVLRSLVFRPSLIGGSSDCCLWQRLVTPLAAPGAPTHWLLPGHEDWCRAMRGRMLSAWESVTGETCDYENEARYHAAGALRILLDNSPALRQEPEDALVISRVKTALTFIDEHYMEDLTNGDLTAVCACSESVLLRCFRQAVGTPPMRYLLRYRIGKAAELLVSTGRKSGDIALSCGFHDLSYFTKLFRRTTGLTPAAYRKRFR